MYDLWLRVEGLGLNFIIVTMTITIPITPVPFHSRFSFPFDSPLLVVSMFFSILPVLPQYQTLKGAGLVEDYWVHLIWRRRFAGLGAPVDSYDTWRIGLSLGCYIDF